MLSRPGRGATGPGATEWLGHHLVVDRTLDEEALEIELRDCGQRREILEGRRVHDLHQVSLAVEQTQDPVQLVGDLAQALQQLFRVDLEHGLERRQDLEQPLPLVEVPHALRIRMPCVDASTTSSTSISQ